MIKMNKTNMTQLCVGPMSKTCVDATIELAYEYDVPLVLIASRRQIECEDLGGGYVNNWTTQGFANYVRSHDPEHKVLLARDHGGPWQHPNEIVQCHDMGEAMSSAKLSFLRDIEAGFDILHLDPMVMDTSFSAEQKHALVLEAIFELYEFCMEAAKRCGREIAFEIGTEEQSISPSADWKLIEYTIDSILHFCENRHFPKPLFYVIQTGTKVMGMENIGDFPSAMENIRAYSRKHRFFEIVEFCRQRGIGIKEHNTDYLPSTALRAHPEIGISAANIAPEFGVAETQKLLTIMEELGMERELSCFVKVCVDSNKWFKWIEPGQDISALDKTKICGHYLFSEQRVAEIIDQVSLAYAKRGKNLNSALKGAIKESILRYMQNFNMI